MNFQKPHTVLISKCPPSRQTLVDHVFGALKQEILSGERKPGEKIPTQEHFAQQFGVSRTVIREAQNKLACLGLIKIDQGRGTFVLSPEPSRFLQSALYGLKFDKSSIHQLFETRFYIERIIVGLAARKCTSADAEILSKLWDKAKNLADRGDLEGFSKEDFSFHHALAVISGNRFFCQILDTIREMNHRFLLGFTRTEGAVERALDFHRRILAAVADNDPKDAEAAMTAHLNDIILALQRMYRFEVNIYEEKKCSSLRTSLKGQGLPPLLR
jgi:GntR family transcriptional repressor for pyruvate dehydrogenase complex